jgi:hypothetical protein
MRRKEGAGRILLREGGTGKDALTLGGFPQERRDTVDFDLSGGGILKNVGLKKRLCGIGPQLGLVDALIFRAPWRPRESLR